MHTAAEPRIEDRQASSGTVAVAVEDAHFAYRDGSGGVRQALGGVSLHAQAGELVAVVGPSGCGKSTLLELICGLREPQSGSVRSEPAVLMPQRDLLLPWLDALDNAAIALRIGGHSRSAARLRAQALFAELGLDGYERARPAELSGGMRQRVAFLRTLLAAKPVLCLDEPFGALDAITRADMQEWLADALVRERRTVVFVTHDVEEAVLLADRVLVLSGRPATLAAEIDVALARPRTRTGERELELRERALAALAQARA
ncbi:MAG TPA: ABC transporter ATP-binding protein [Solirubrobacteraceae bacterium]|nr:ABC transporter ATP-binding protein [Solirubrobacteraceae bacterium]